MCCAIADTQPSTCRPQRDENILIDRIEVNDISVQEGMETVISRNNILVNVSSHNGQFCQVNRFSNVTKLNSL